MSYNGIMIANLTAVQMKQALKMLDSLLSRSVTLIVGGGGAMILGHKFPLATSDIDAIPKGMEFSELEVLVKKVAKELGIAPDWLNPWFGSFAYILPSDYETRLLPVFDGKHLKALALGADDLLVMKCFAHRQKDVGHAKALIKSGANVENVRVHIESLLKKKIPKANEALDFLDDIEDQS